MALCSRATISCCRNCNWRALTRTIVQPRAARNSNRTMSFGHPYVDPSAYPAQLIGDRDLSDRPGESAAHEKQAQPGLLWGFCSRIDEGERRPEATDPSGA